MLKYYFEIIYKKGKQNMVVDALSRKYEDVKELLCDILFIQPNWRVEEREEWKNDTSMWTLIKQLQKDPSVLDTFVCRDDSLWYKDLLYTCKESQLKQKVILELHTY